jgi:predicted RNA binding protein YcfA (HicA-like mRNA interferase family)
MPNLPQVSGKKAVRAFERAGFSVVRTRGSHHIMKKPGFRHRLSIPVHGNEDVGEGLLRSQIELAGLTVEQFIDLL